MQNIECGCSSVAIIDENDVQIEQSESDRRKNPPPPRRFESVLYAPRGFLSKMLGVWLWPFIVLVPVIFFVILFGVMPLNNPRSSRFRDYAAFTLLTSPITIAVVALLHYSALLFSLGSYGSVGLLVRLGLAVYATVAITASVVWEYNHQVPPKLFFAWMMLIAFFITAVFIRNAEHQARGGEGHCQRGEWWWKHKQFVTFLKVEILLVVYFFFLLGYLFAFRDGGAAAQRLLPVCLLGVTFTFRKIVLAMTGVFHIEPAMFLSGFLVENMEDMFQVLSFPLVIQPSSFAIIWVTTTASNLANLVFLTMPWFHFRIWVKEFLKRIFTKGNGSPWDVDEVPDLREIEDERGHSNNLPGYRRRQVRFFIWKILSQLFAAAFYIVMAIILRYGRNSNYFIFGSQYLQEEGFRHSIYYCMGNILFLFAAATLGHFFIKFYVPKVHSQMVEIHAPLLFHRRWVGFMLLFVISNGMIALSLILEHNQIWFSYNPPDRLDS